MENSNINKWPKAITVDKRIVRILSSSTYSNFPNAIKEIIVNGYDADANVVYLDIDTKNSIITIIDDGKGMNENDFSFYLRIAGKSRKKKSLTEKGRKIVGQFGVGFLSVLPFCDKYLIETTKIGSPEIVTATISSGDYFNESSSIDVDKIPIDGGIKIDNSLINHSYTKIRLVGFSKLTKSFFKGEYEVKGKRNTIKKYSPIDLLKWELQENLPIEYNNEELLGDELNKLSNNYSRNKFNVILNEDRLYRNIHAENILDKSEETIQLGKIKFKYFISTNYKPLVPTESRYLLIRNLNVGVGDRTTFGIGMDGRVYARLAHLSGEILIEDGLNELISVSREKFNYSTEFEQLKDFFRAKLRKFANELDSIQLAEKFSKEFLDTSKVSNLQNLNVDSFEENIKKLQKKGFEIIEKPNVQNEITNVINKGIEINKSKRKIHINTTKENRLKLIEIGNKNYKLKLESWDYLDTKLPAIKFIDDIVIINEKYPLFKDKNKVDTFIKINVILLNYFSDNKINEYVYKSILNDLLNTFNK